MTQWFVGALAALSLILLPALIPSTAETASNDPPIVAPTSGPWDAGDGFRFEKEEKKTRRSLSGVACPANASGRRLCLAVFDEGAEARHLTIENKSEVTDNERIVLRTGDIEHIELDAEAAATDDAYYYVTGSHSAKRKECANNPDSRHVIRFRVDPAAGRALRDPARPGEATGTLAGYADTPDLWTLMTTVPDLKDHVGDKMCLGSEPPDGKRGVNIEGLAIMDGRLFFGFRGPARDGQSSILAVDAHALFEGGDANPKLFTITVGRGRGIRDLHAVKDGILVLAGPDDDSGNETVGWVVAHWNGPDVGDDARTLARLDLSRVERRACDDSKIKPEAIAVIGDDPGKAYELIVFSDGLCDGGPLAFTIPR